MEFRSFEDLVMPDERTLRFTPIGLSTGGLMSPQGALDYQQRTIGQADLVAAVPEDTRASFERLRTLHTYGVLCYDLFTVAGDQSGFVLEQALAERFVDYYGGQVPLVSGDRTAVLTVSRFEQVYDALNRGGSHAKGGWTLQLPRSRGTMRFRGTFRHLFDWARREGLLRGQRNRHRES